MHTVLLGLKTGYKPTRHFSSRLMMDLKAGGGGGGWKLADGKKLFLWVSVLKWGMRSLVS